MKRKRCTMGRRTSSSIRVMEREAQQRLRAWFHCTERSILRRNGRCPSTGRGSLTAMLDCADLAILRFERGGLRAPPLAGAPAEFREFDASGPLALEAKQYLRKLCPSTCPHDAIVGYRADDSYSLLPRFHRAPSQQLGRAMHLGRLGQQFVLRRADARFDRRASPVTGGLARRVVRSAR